MSVNVSHTRAGEYNPVRAQACFCDYPERASSPAVRAMGVDRVRTTTRIIAAPFAAHHCLDQVSRPTTEGKEIYKVAHWCWRFLRAAWAAFFHPHKGAPAGRERVPCAGGRRRVEHGLVARDGHGVAAREHGLVRMRRLAAQAALERSQVDDGHISHRAHEIENANNKAGKGARERGVPEAGSEEGRKKGEIVANALGLQA
jgi:hypothetical protein